MKQTIFKLKIKKLKLRLSIDVLPQTDKKPSVVHDVPDGPPLGGTGQHPRLPRPQAFLPQES